MTHTAVATQVHQALDIHRDFATQVAFHDEFADFVAQLLELAIVQVLDLLVRRDTRLDTDILRAWTTHAVDRCQADYRVLMIWDVYPCNTCHSLFLNQ